MWYFTEKITKDKSLFWAHTGSDLTKKQKNKAREEDNWKEDAVNSVQFCAGLLQFPTHRSCFECNRGGQESTIHQGKSSTHETLMLPKYIFWRVQYTACTVIQVVRFIPWNSFVSVFIWSLCCSSCLHRSFKPSSLVNGSESEILIDRKWWTSCKYQFYKDKAVLTKLC